MQIKLTNIVVKSPGSMHDSYILSNSVVENRLQGGAVRDGWLLLVVELVRDANVPTNRNNLTSPETKGLATLRYLATGKMQLRNDN